MGPPPRCSHLVPEPDVRGRPVVLGILRQFVQDDLALHQHRDVAQLLPRPHAVPGEPPGPPLVTGRPGRRVVVLRQAESLEKRQVPLRGLLPEPLAELVLCRRPVPVQVDDHLDHLAVLEEARPVVPGVVSRLFPSVRRFRHRTMLVLRAKVTYEIKQNICSEMNIDLYF